MNEIKDYFIAELREIKLMSKNLSKYIASFEYLAKSLFATAIGAPAGIISASCSLAFSIKTGFIKKFLKTIRNKKKKYNKIVMLARSKLKRTESKISKALVVMELVMKTLRQSLIKKKNIEN